MGENKKHVVKVFHVYPAWGMRQLSGAVICDDEDTAHGIAREIKTTNVYTEIEEMSGDFENDLWKEWAEDIDRLTRYNHYQVDGLNIMTAWEYYEIGFEFIAPNFDDAVFNDNGNFVRKEEGE